MTEHENQASAALNPGQVTATKAAALGLTLRGNYFCRLHRLHDSLDAGEWDGPYRASGPEGAAVLWVRSVWDCRHGEEISVAVKGEPGGVCVVRLRTRVTVGVVNICQGPPAPNA